MFRVIRRSVLPLVCGTAFVVSALAQNTTVAIESGKLQGAVNEGVLSFKRRPVCGPAHR